jgi:hypothetical protein
MGTVLCPIVLKVGFSEDQSRIEAEYHIYEHLVQKGVPLPKLYGLFQDRDPDGATAILMEHCGTRIDHIPGGPSTKQKYV